MRKKIAVPNHLYVAPTTYGWSPATSPFEVVNDLSSVNAIKLRNDEVACALITPIDYGRESSDYQIVPDVAISSRGTSGTVCLFFKTGLKRIETAAVDIGSTSEIVLARLILAECYDCEPKFVPMMPSLDTMLDKADAALLVGNEVLAMHDHPQYIDLVDEWEDLTALPYVHGFWGCKPNALTSGEMDHLRAARDNGVKNIKTIASFTSDQNQQVRDSIEEYIGQFSYDLDAEVEESLSEFFRFSYFYGMIEDIPDIRISDKISGPDGSPDA